MLLQIFLLHVQHFPGDSGMVFYDDMAAFDVLANCLSRSVNIDTFAFSRFQKARSAKKARRELVTNSFV